MAFSAVSRSYLIHLSVIFCLSGCLTYQKTHSWTFVFFFFFPGRVAVTSVQAEFCIVLSYLVWPLCGFPSLGQSTPPALLPVSWLHKPFRQGH